MLSKLSPKAARLRGQLTYANVVSTLCLFIVVTGGTAIAAVAANQVTSRSIKNNAVKSPDVKDNSLTGADVNESTLTGLPAGPAGATGATGATGTTGPQGPPGSDATIAPGGVSTGLLADNAVTNPKMADNAIGSAEVIVNSLGITDLADNSVGCLETTICAINDEIVDGGVDHFDIAPNEVKSSELDLYINDETELVEDVGGNGTLSTEVIEAGCDPSDQVLNASGDWSFVGNNADQYITESVSVNGNNDWEMIVQTDEGDVNFTLAVLCLNA